MIASSFCAALIVAGSTVLALPNPLALPAVDLEIRQTGPLNIPPPSGYSFAAPQGQLKYIVLGIGSQNYTCADSSPSTVPSALGAIANLYNVGPFLQKYPYFIPHLPGLALTLQAKFGISVDQLFRLPSYGKHYFDVDRQPAFDLPNASPAARLVAKKVESCSAPSDAFPGLSNEGAVPWLGLTDAGNGKSFGGLTNVYRLETAGGSAPPTCAGKSGTFQVSYAAEYWFYG